MGAVVTFEGRQMTISQIYSDGDIKMVDTSLSGITALASAIAVCASLTECELRGNSLGVEGWTIIFNALRDSPTSKIAMWDISNEHLGPKIAKPLADYISVTTSITSVR